MPAPPLKERRGPVTKAESENPRSPDFGREGLTPLGPTTPPLTEVVPRSINPHSTFQQPSSQRRTKR